MVVGFGALIVGVGLYCWLKGKSVLVRMDCRCWFVLLVLEGESVLVRICIVGVG
jgi:hypothetical protein